MSTVTYERKKYYRTTAGTQSEFELHAKGCSHSRRNRLQTFHEVRVPVDQDVDLKDVARFSLNTITEPQQGFSVEDVRIMDCAKSLNSR